MVKFKLRGEKHNTWPLKVTRITNEGKEIKAKFSESGEVAKKVDAFIAGLREQVNTAKPPKPVAKAKAVASETPAKEGTTILL